MLYILYSTVMICICCCFEQRKHESSFESMKVARKRKAESDEPAVPAKKFAQTSLVTATGSVPQSVVDKLIMEFIIDYMEPLSLVEAPAFVKLITGLQPTRTVMSRKTLDGTLYYAVVK